MDEDIKRLGFESVRELSQLFVSSAHQMKTDLEASISNGDLVKTEKIAHKLNGAAGNFGFYKLCELLKSIERSAALNTQMDSQLFEQFRVEYELALEHLDDYMSQQTSTEKISNSA